MKRHDLKSTNLDSAVQDAQHERVIITRNGKPVALILGVEGMDEEQLQLGSSDKFWRLIEERRSEENITRAQLEHRVKQTRRPGNRV